MSFNHWRLVNGKGEQIYAGEGDGKLYLKGGFRRLPVRTMIPSFELTERKLVKAKKIDAKSHWELE